MVNGPACPQCGSPLRWMPEQPAWCCDRCRTSHPVIAEAGRVPPAWPEPPRTVPPAPHAVPTFAPATPGTFAGTHQSRPPVAASTRPPVNVAGVPPYAAVPGPAIGPYASAPPHDAPPPATPWLEPTQVEVPRLEVGPGPMGPAQGLAVTPPRARAPSHPRLLWVAVAALVVILGGVAIGVTLSGGGPDRGAAGSGDALASAGGVDPPTSPDCTRAVAAYVELFRRQRPTVSAAGVRRVHKKVAEHCAEDGWPEDAIQCLAAAAVEDRERCLARLTASQTDKMMSDVVALADQDQRSNAVPPEPTVPAVAGGGSDPMPPEDAHDAGVVSAGSRPTLADLPPICAEWDAQITKLGRCRRLRASQRTSMRSSYDILVTSFLGMASISATTRKKYETTCQQGVDAALELRKSCR